ncbi:MAG: YadA-like family protein [Alphaproteobacteria bacterium]|nr:YadA-like family protein [Alphaproteobacteria bacterium]
MNLKLSKTALRELTRLYRGVLIAGLLSTAMVATGVKAETTLPLNVGSSDDITISGETFSGVTEKADNGWANIENAGKLTLDGVNLGTAEAGNAGAYGVIDTWGTLDVKGGKFQKNTGNWGGTIYNEGNTTVANTIFEENLAQSSGGAIATTTGNTQKLSVTDATFTGNHAIYDGGAIANFSGLVVKDSKFIGNTADYKADETGAYTVAVTDDDIPVGGGAIALGAVSSTSVGTISGTTFDSNKSGTNGGAVGTRLAANANNSAAKLDIAATFTGNEALKNGGAIYNSFYADNGLGKGNGVTVTGEFSSNKAGANGGAIYNDGTVDKAGNAGGVMTITDATFTDNNATTAGGAIYNTGALTIAANTKDVAFSGNTANGQANDIYNAGTLALNAASGRAISLAGGIDGDANNKGKTTITGAGYVQIANALKNQEVTNNGELRLDKADLTGTTILGSGSMKIVGDSEMEGTNVINQNVEVEDGQELAITGTTENRASVTGTGALKNAIGGTLNIKNADIGVNVFNAGTLISDPTTYAALVDNSGYASFDQDTFKSTATLNNTGMVNLLNGVKFEDGAQITGTGTIDLVSGTTQFGTSAAIANTNVIKVANGAKFSGTINGGSLDTRNGLLETTGLGSITGDAYVDGSLTDGTVDAITGGTIKGVNLLSAAYGDTGDSVTLSAGSGTFDANVAVEGNNYYTSVVADSSGNLVFSDKLINTSTLDKRILGTGDTTTPAGAVVLGDRAATTTIGTANAQIALDNTAKTIGLTGLTTFGTDGFKLGGDTVTGIKTSSELAAAIAGSSDVETALAGASDSNLVTEKAVVAGVTALFNEKQTWVDKTLGITSANPDAVKTAYTGTYYLANETTLTAADKALDSTLKATNDIIGAGKIGSASPDIVGTAGTLVDKTIGSSYTVTQALADLNATNVNENATANTLAGIIDGSTVDAATGALTASSTTLNTGNGANLVATANTLGNLVNANGTKTIATEIGVTSADLSVVENINGIAQAVKADRTRIGNLETNMLTKDTAATGTYDATAAYAAGTIGKTLQTVETDIATAKTDITNITNGTTYTDAMKNNVKSTIAAAAGTGLTVSTDGKLTVDTAAAVADGNTGYVTSDLLFDQGYQTESDVTTLIADNAAAGKYSNTTSGLTATTIQGAIDEVEGRVDKVEAAIGSAVTSTNYAAADKTINENISALDKAIGAQITEDGKYIKKSATNTVNDNIKALDKALEASNTAIGDVSSLFSTGSSNIGRGDSVAAILSSVDTDLDAATAKNTFQDTQLASLATEIGGTYDATTGTFKHTEFTALKNITSTASITSAIDSLDNALGNVQTAKSAIGATGADLATIVTEVNAKFTSGAIDANFANTTVDSLTIDGGNGYGITNTGVGTFSTVNAGHSSLADNSLIVTDGSGTSSTLTKDTLTTTNVNATTVAATTVKAGENGTALSDNSLTLKDSAGHETVLSAITDGASGSLLNVGTGMKVGGNTTIAGTLSIGAANAITGTSNTLDMGKNALTNVKGLTLTNGDASDEKTATLSIDTDGAISTGNASINAGTGTVTAAVLAGTSSVQVGTGNDVTTLTSGANGLNIDKGLTVATDKFTVTATGDVTAAGNADIAGALKVGSSDQFQVTADGAVTTTSTVTADGESKFGKDTNGVYSLDVTDSLVTANKELDAKGGVKFGTGTDEKVMTSVKQNEVAALNATGNDQKLVSAASVAATREAINTDAKNVLGGIYKIADTERTVSYDNEALLNTTTANGFETGATSLTDALKKYAENAQAATGVSYDDDGSVATTYTKATAVDYDGLNEKISLKAAIEQLDGNIGGPITSVQTRGTGAIAAGNTVNQNLAALDTAIGGNVTKLYNGVATDNSVNANIDAVNATIGDITTLSAGTGSTGNAITNGTGTPATTVVEAINNVDATLGQIHGLKNGNSTLKDKSNLADGTTVEQHLVALDNAIGDRTQLANSKYIGPSATVADAMMSLDTNLALTEQRVRRVEKEMRGGFASMAALSALVPNARAAGDTQISVGAGAYRDHQGMAIGAFHYFNDNVLANMGLSYGGDKSTVVRAGVTFGW